MRPIDAQTQRIPLFAYWPALQSLLPEVARRQRAVLDSGRYILGPEVEAFEIEFAEQISRRNCVGVGSGTDALTIALRALGIGNGDEVIVPAYTFFATAEAVVNAGARPAFADVDLRIGCVTAATVEPAIGERTRAIVPVHMFGNPAPMHGLQKLASSRGLTVVEDAAQAAGALLDGDSAGSFGDAAAFSFYPSKNLGAFGDAGALVTDDDEVAERARRLRDHGARAQWRHEEVGYNSRLDELQAAGLRVALPHLEEWTKRRRQAADWYREEGLGELVMLPAETEGGEGAYHLYVVLDELRESLLVALERSGVEARAYYTQALHRQPALGGLAGGRAFPNAEALAARNVALPMGPALTREQVARVTAAVGAAVGERPEARVK